jgi:hypothetical protein
VPRDDLPALGEGDVAQLGEQPRLADAGITGEQHGAALRLGVGRANPHERDQLVQLALSSDEGPSVSG